MPRHSVFSSTSIPYFERCFRRIAWVWHWPINQGLTCAHLVQPERDYAIGGESKLTKGMEGAGSPGSTA